MDRIGAPPPHTTSIAAASRWTLEHVFGRTLEGPPKGRGVTGRNGGYGGRGEAEPRNPYSAEVSAAHGGSV